MLLIFAFMYLMTPELDKDEVVRMDSSNLLVGNQRVQLVLHEGIEDSSALSWCMRTEIIQRWRESTQRKER